MAAAAGGANVRHGSVVAQPSQRFGVVVGRFNDLVTKLLLEGAYGAFTAHGVDLANVEVRAPSRRHRGGGGGAGVGTPGRPWAGWGVRAPAARTNRRAAVGW